MSVTRFDRVIPPGGKGEVVLEVDTRRSKGKIKKTARVLSNDPQRPNLSIQLKAQVKKSIDISPKDFVRFRVEKGEAWSREFKISSLRKKDFQILDIGTPARTISATYNLVSNKDNPDKGNLYNLKVLVSPETPIGIVKGAVKIYTDIPGVSPVRINLRGKVEGPIHYQPEQLTFTPIINEGPVSRTVDICKVKGENFCIKDVKISNNDLKWQIIPVEEGKSYVLVVFWAKEEMKKIHRGVIHVFTDAREQGQLDIPYTIFPSVERRKWM